MTCNYQLTTPTALAVPGSRGQAIEVLNKETMPDG
jgi:hypothetical protein